MFALLCTMAHSIIRQMAINTQNIIVLTLEFTNYSFFAAKEKPRDLHHFVSGSATFCLDA